MFLFLMGVGVSEMGVLALLAAILLFLVTRSILKRRLKTGSPTKVYLWSIIIAIIGTPFLLGLLILLLTGLMMVVS